jgi:hypothetical protein
MHTKNRVHNKLCTLQMARVTIKGNGHQIDNLYKLLFFQNLFLYPMEVYFTHIDTACILLEINGYKILTDPTLDLPGKLYHHGFGTFSRKLTRPALSVGQLGDVDLILLSHHQHKDNFDVRGKSLPERLRL